MRGLVVDVNVYVLPCIVIVQGVPGVTDLRKAIDGLSVYVEEQLELNPPAHLPCTAIVQG